MASSTNDGSTSDGGSNSGGAMDGIIDFLTQPLGIGLVVGVIATGYVAWRVI